jgi:hypothetical protein
MLLIFFLWLYTGLCPHGSLIDRYDKARFAPAHNTRIISITEDKIDLEFIDNRQRKLVSLDYNKETLMDKGFKEQKKGGYIIVYCSEHFFAYQAEMLKGK